MLNSCRGSGLRKYSACSICQAKYLSDTAVLLWHWRLVHLPMCTNRIMAAQMGTHLRAKRKRDEMSNYIRRAKK